MKIASFQEAVQILERYIPRPGSARVYTLERMEQLMTVLDNPQDSLQIVHVAGTSGKTSTAYYTASLLRQCGVKVGLTVSPHIDQINERLQIDMIPLPEAEYCKYLGEFMDIVVASKLRPTYFELLIAFAYWVFAKQKVDYAVIEVGLGGLLDATNVVLRPDKICVITDLGLDHTDILGRSVTEIAAQKAGIIRRNNVVFMHEQDEAVMDVIREVCDQSHATLHEVWELPNRVLPNNLPLFQRRNWHLAWSVYQFLVERDGLPTLSAEQLATTTTTYVPARMELVSLKHGKTLVLDGAHNAQKIRALVESLKRQFPKATFAVLLSFAHNKDAQLNQSIKELSRIADYMIITSFGSSNASYKSSVNLIKIAEQCHVVGYDSWASVTDNNEAFAKLQKRPESVLLMTGSFYLLHELRPLVASLPKP